MVSDVLYRIFSEGYVVDLLVRLVRLWTIEMALENVLVCSSKVEQDRSRCSHIASNWMDYHVMKHIC